MYLDAPYIHAGASRYVIHSPRGRGVGLDFGSECRLAPGGATKPTRAALRSGAVVAAVLCAYAASAWAWHL